MSRFIKGLSAGLVFLGFFYFSNSLQAYSPKSKFYTVKTEHFFIHYPEELTGVAKEMMVITEKVHAHLSPKINWEPKTRTHLVLVDDSDIANGQATVFPNNYMKLWIYPPDADSPLDYYHEYLEMLFMHEYTHILHMDQTHGITRFFRFFLGRFFSPNGLSPGWIREGLASYYESFDGYGRANYSFVEMVMRSAILEDNFPKIDEISLARVKWPGGNAQYYYGVKFLDWLADNYGEEKLAKYMKRHASSVWPFSASHKAKMVFGKSFYTLWKEFRADLEKKYTKQKEELAELGLTPFEPYQDKKNYFYSYPLAHPIFGDISFYESNLDNGSAIVRKVAIYRDKEDLAEISTNQNLRKKTKEYYLQHESEKSHQEESEAPDIDIEGQENQDWMRDKKISKKDEQDNLDDQKSPYPEKSLRLTGSINGQRAYSRDGGTLIAVAARGSKIQPYYLYDDIYIKDLTNKRSHRVGYATGETKKTRESYRAKDPDFSPKDGGRRWILMVRNDQGTDNLYLYDLGEEICWHSVENKLQKDLSCKPTGRYLTQAEKYTQFSNPRFSPDGNYIAVSMKTHGDYRDLVLLDEQGNFLTKITNDQSLDNHPQWTLDGKSIYFSSDRSGISNIYRYDLVTQTIHQVTNVLTGVYHPALSNDDKELYVQYYTSDGPKLYKVAVNQLKDYNQLEAKSLKYFQENFFDEKTKKLVLPFKSVQSSGYAKLMGDENEPVIEEEIIEGAKKYQPLNYLLRPRYIFPNVYTVDDDFIFEAVTGNFDPLGRHSWSAGVNYRTENDFVGFNASYAYLRYLPNFFVNFSRYSLNWGILSANSNEDFYEERLRGDIGVSISPGSNTGYAPHNFSFSYFYEDRDNLSSVSGINSDFLVNLDRYAGLNLIYTYGKFNSSPYAISVEKGKFFRTSFTFTDSILGSAEANEQLIWTGDLRYYFELPWSDHHVFALRGAGGYVFGDKEQLVAGSLRFGGPWGAGSPRLFSFRGLPGVTYRGDRAMLFSAEYRLPIANVERGIGTWPIYLQKLHLAFFADYGDSWVRNAKIDDGKGFFDDFFLSVGAELRGDFNIFYGLPLNARAGYGIIVTNRDQIEGLKDGNLDTDVKNGVFYFQIGTSF